VTGQLQDLSALSPGKDAWYPVGLSWLQSWAGSLGQDKPLLPRRESNRSSSFVQPVVKFLHRPSHPRSCRRINMFCVFIIHKRYQTFRTIGSAVQCNFPHSSVQFSLSHEEVLLFCRSKQKLANNNENQLPKWTITGYKVPTLRTRFLHNVYLFFWRQERNDFDTDAYSNVTFYSNSRDSNVKIKYSKVEAYV
jgi:hypothetical protein